MKLPTPKEMIKFMKDTHANVAYYNDGYWLIVTQISESKSKRLEYAFREAMLDHLEDRKAAELIEKPEGTQ